VNGLSHEVVGTYHNLILPPLLMNVWKFRRSKLRVMCSLSSQSTEYPPRLAAAAAPATVIGFLSGAPPDLYRAVCALFAKA
jgi:hypothetical protein